MYKSWSFVECAKDCLANFKISPRDCRLIITQSPRGPSVLIQLKRTIIHEWISQKWWAASFDSFLLARSVYAVVRYPPAGSP